MRTRTLRKRALSVLLMTAVVGCYSMVALAGDTKMAAEIVVSGAKDSIVTVNGEATKSGRTIFSSSTIATSADASAVINVKNVGKLKLAPNTTTVVNFDEKGITGNIVQGKLTVLSASEAVNITAPNGKVANLVAGESVLTVRQDDDEDDDAGSGTWFIWALVLGGAAAAIVLAATSDNNTVDLGGGTTVVSPIR